MWKTSIIKWKCPKNKTKTMSIRQRLLVKHTCIDLAGSFSFVDGVDFLEGGCSLDVLCLFLVSFVVICNSKKHWLLFLPIGLLQENLWYWLPILSTGIHDEVWHYWWGLMFSSEFLSLQPMDEWNPPLTTITSGHLMQLKQWALKIPPEVHLLWGNSCTWVLCCICCQFL